MPLSIFVLVTGGLPWVDGVRLTLADEGDGEISLAFHRCESADSGSREAFLIADAMMRANSGAPGPGTAAPSLGSGHATVVEITVEVRETGSPDADHDAVHRGIDALHRVDLATVIANEEARQPVAPGDVWPVLCLRRQQPQGGARLATRTIVLGEGKEPPPSPSELRDAAVPGVLATLAAIEAGDPLARWWEWRAAALASQKAVRPTEAVLQIAVAIEVLVDSASALARYELGVSPDRAAAEDAWDPRRKLVSGLGLDPAPWDLVAGLRAGVVRLGRLPAPDRLEAAFHAADELHRSVLDRVLEREEELPFTAALLAVDRSRPPRSGGIGGQDLLRWLGGYLTWRATLPEASA